MASDVIHVTSAGAGFRQIQSVQQYAQSLGIAELRTRNCRDADVNV